MSIAEQRERQEGFLYWLAWTAQNGTSLFSTADGQGPWRRVTICGVPASVLTGIVQGVLAEVGVEQPGARRGAARRRTGAGTQPGSPVDQLLDTQFGSCNFNALPTTPPPGGGGPILPIPRAAAPAAADPAGTPPVTLP